MKTSMDFLPDHKQRELKQIAEMIEREHKKVNMVILYGSYARDTWVEDIYQVENGTTYSYISDYDLMIVMSSENAAKKTGFQIELRKKIANLGIKTPINLIFHGYPYICQMLAEKQYFFCDVYHEGIVLSNVWDRHFKEPTDISYGLRVRKSEWYYNEWFKSASDFLINYYFNFKQKKYKLASFELHQSAERFYMCALLVFTDYKAKIHDLEVLDKVCSDEDLRFREAFPRKTKEEDDLFKLLRDAYIGSRYEMNFKVTKEQLEYLAERVEVLKNLVDKICNEKIDHFREVSKEHPEKIIESNIPDLIAPAYGSKIKRINPEIESKNKEKLARAEKKGEKNKALEIAKNSLDNGLDSQTISKITGLSIEEIEKLK